MSTSRYSVLAFLGLLVWTRFVDQGLRSQANYGIFVIDETPTAKTRFPLKTPAGSNEPVELEASKKSLTMVSLTIVHGVLVCGSMDLGLWKPEDTLDCWMTSRMTGRLLTFWVCSCSLTHQ